MKPMLAILAALAAAIVCSLPGAGQTDGQAAVPSPAIAVNQAGFLPAAEKVALITVDTPAEAFTVRKAASGAVVFNGKLAAPVADADSGDRPRAADFTAVKTPGRYYLEVPGVGRSWEFSIDPKVYDRVLYLSARAFYGQRCGIAVDLGPEFPGFKHAACHLDGAWHVSSGKTGPHISKGGWHYAGDYGRYMVNSGISTGTLLWAYELYHAQLSGVKLSIPETGKSKTPDILSEIKWNLDWMLTLQDADGGVHHKQTSEDFCGFIMPEKDKLVSYVIGSGKEPFKTSCATADFAAVMAAAARIYRPFDTAYAARTLAAARAAFAWVEKNPSALFTNNNGVLTGAYGDRNCADEMLWAAAELGRTTGDGAYEQYFVAHYQYQMRTLRANAPQEWANVGNMGLWTYALGKGANSEAVSTIRAASVKAADEIAARTASAGYRNSMTARNYVWGSNGVAANYGMQLLVAHALEPNATYVRAANDNLHYLLGRNPLSLSYVTQVGAHPYQHPHHRPSGDDGIDAPWPGMLSGGPNARPGDPVMQEKIKPGTPPAKSYVDDQGAYSANEMAINWNAPLVFLLAGVMR